MDGIFINKINIKNYKCFVDQDINFSVPDGKTLGSGLNILIGENGVGKTAVLEGFNMLTQTYFTLENRLDIRDFNDFKKEIQITAQTEEFRCKMPYPGNYFISNGLEITAKNRDRKASGKLLSSSFSTSSSFMPTTEYYFNSKGEPSKNLIPLYTMYKDDTIEGDGINIFYFDKNRTRQLSSGTYKTTFERICDDLNWRFNKELTPELIDTVLENISGEYFKTVRENAQKGIGQKIADELASFFNSESYKNLKIELLNLLHPYTDAFFAVREESDLKQIKTKDLGSGVEMILTLLLLKNIASQSKGSIIFLIDEPELHLHPKAQDKLMELLLDESIDKQIILSSHSPYIFRNCLDKAGSIIVMNKAANFSINFHYAQKNEWGLFPWSPSWGEINFLALNLPTVEFHNELYGRLQEISGQNRIENFDKWLNEKFGIPLISSWIRLNNGVAGNTDTVSLQTYIRHSIHHPENNLNKPFTVDELSQSIQKMIHVLRKLNDQNH